MAKATKQEAPTVLEEAAAETGPSAEDLQKENLDLKDTIESLKNDLKVAHDTISQMQRDAAAPAAKSASCSDADHVVLDGVLYDVTHRNTVKELANDYHKRLVREENTAVVIEKHGG